MNGIPRITFGMIVLNGNPFIAYNLRSLYPFAHEIIVVEGAAPGAAAIATANGHSTDGTLDTLWSLKRDEDPEGKIHIIIAEDAGYPNGFWLGEKDEQSQAYAERATGDYLWQIDTDEFYQPEDMRSILLMLQNRPEITGMAFKQITFWGGLDYITDGWYLRQGAAIYYRLFRWGPGYKYSTHRPPTVINAQGQNVRDLEWVSSTKLEQQGIFLYHYSLLFPKQVTEKSIYYHFAEWSKRDQSQGWSESVYKHLQRPYRVHNVYEYPSWLERFKGHHPPAIRQMMQDIVDGKLNIELRQTDDIEALLRSPGYQFGRWLIATLEPVGIWLGRSPFIHMVRFLFNRRRLYG